MLQTLPLPRSSEPACRGSDGNREQRVQLVQVLTQGSREFPTPPDLESRVRLIKKLDEEIRKILFELGDNLDAFADASAFTAFTPTTTSLSECPRPAPYGRRPTRRRAAAGGGGAAGSPTAPGSGGIATVQQTIAIPPNATITFGPNPQTAGGETTFYPTTQTTGVVNAVANRTTPRASGWVSEEL